MLNLLMCMCVHLHVRGAAMKHEGAHLIYATYINGLIKMATKHNKCIQ